MKTFYHFPGGSQYAEPGETRKGDEWTGRGERVNWRPTAGLEKEVWTRITD